MHMRTTLVLQDDLMAEAARLTGIKEKTALVHAGLRLLIEQKARERLIALGGSAPNLRLRPRRRF